MAEGAEEDNCRPEVVELVWTTVAALCDSTDQDNCLFCGGNNGTATEPEPDDTDAHEDGRAAAASSTPSSLPTTVPISSPASAVLNSSYSSNPSSTSSSLQSPP